jgi:hypothetical protein
MEDMAARYVDRSVRSAFLYTRESHPGENYRHHASMEDKRHHARTLQAEFKLKRQILLDDLVGTAHRAYGILPNMTWIIGQGGLIHYRAAWTDPRDIEDALKATMDGLARRTRDKLVPFYAERWAWRTRDDDKFRTRLANAGTQAVTDFYGKK